MLQRVRRRRRRRGLLPLAFSLVVVALVLFVVVGGIARIGRGSGSYWTSVDRSFGVQASVVAKESNATAADLKALLHSIGTFGRPELYGVLDTLVAATQTTEHEAGAISNPAPQGTVSTPFIRAMADRELAVERFRSVVEGLLGVASVPASGSSNPGVSVQGSGTRAQGFANTGATLDPSSAVNDLAEVSALLEKADELYALARARLRADPGGALLPRSAWMGSGMLAPASVASVVSTIQASSSLAADVHVELSTVRLVPPVGPIPAPSGVPEVPPTHQLTVTATVQVPGGVASTVRREVNVRAGTAMAVAMPALEVSPGVTYQLTVAIQPPPGQTVGLGTLSVTSTIAVGNLPPSASGCDE